MTHLLERNHGERFTRSWTVLPDWVLVGMNSTARLSDERWTHRMTWPAEIAMANSGYTAGEFIGQPRPHC